MSFWGEPAVYAGPYGRPARPGIFDRVVQGLGLATRIADTYQGWQNLKDVEKQRALQGLASRVGLTQALNPEGTPASPELVEQAQKVGVPLPKMTDKMRAGMSDRVMGSIAPIAGEAVPGGMATRLDSPELAQKQGQYAQSIAAIPEVGAPMIPGKPLTLDQARMNEINKVADPELRRQLLFKGQQPGIVYNVGTGETTKMETPGKVSIARPPGITNEEWDRRQAAILNRQKELKNTPGAARPSSGGRGSGRITPAELQQQRYQEFKKANPDANWLDFLTATEKARQAGKPDPTKIQTRTTGGGQEITPGGIKMQDKITRKERVDSSKPGDQNQPAGQQYLLPKGGQMVPVDKETYDAYQKKYGQQ